MASGNPDAFSLTTSPFTSPVVKLLVVADVNGDGVPDVVGRTAAPPGQASPLRIALGKAGGGFTTDAPLLAAGVPNFVDPRIVVGDFTGDGRTDMVVYDAGTYDWSIRTTKGLEPVLLVGGADGKFTASTALRDPLKALVQPVGPNYRGGYQVDLTLGVKDVAAADIDGDGDLDLWVESYGSANIPSHFMVNNGNGTFSVDLNGRIAEKTLLGDGYGTAGDYFRYGIGRFVEVNGDARPDLFLGQIRDNDPTHLNQTSYVVLNDGQGRFPVGNRVALPRPDFYQGYTAVQGVVDVDLNKDGRKDLVLIHTRNDDVSGAGVQPPWTGTYVQVLVQNAAGQFIDETAQRMGDQSAWSASTLAGGAHATGISAFDVNKDGITDLLLSYGMGLRPDASRPFLFLGRADGSFVAASPDLVTGGDAYFGEDLRALDFNGDGNIDFLHVDSGPGANGTYDGVLTDDISILVTQLGKGALGASQAGGAAELVRAGNRSDYTLAKAAGGITLTRGGASETVAAQRLKFDDKTVNLQVGDAARSISKAQLDSLIELYIAYINRVPDADGMQYWIGQLKAGQTLAQIGEAFYNAALQFSSLTGYSPTMTNGDFVKLVYRNVLGRSEPDAEGLAYWSKALAEGSASRGTLVASILGSAHTFKGHAQFGYVADLLDNKIAVGRKFAIEKGLVFNTPEASVSNGMAIAAAVTPTSTAAAITLIGVNDALDLYA